MNELRKPLLVQKTQAERLCLTAGLDCPLGMFPPFGGDMGRQDVRRCPGENISILDPERPREAPVRTDKPEIVVDVLHIHAERTVVRDGEQELVLLEKIVGNAGGAGWTATEK